MSQRHDDPPAEGLSRRTILTGAAWAVPVLTVSTATPAVAASVRTGVGTATMAFNNTTTWRVAKGIRLDSKPWHVQAYDGVAGNASIRNTWQAPSEPITAISLQLSFPAAVGITTDTSAITVDGSGWSVVAASAGTSYTVITFGWVGLGEVGRTSAKLQFRIPAGQAITPSSDVPRHSIGWQASSPQAVAPITGSSSG